MNDYTPCAWCELPASGYASRDPGWADGIESCGLEFHGFAFRPDPVLLKASIAEVARAAAEKAWDEFDADVENPYRRET